LYVGLALAAVSCQAQARDRDPALKTIEIYDLITALPRATARVDNPDYMARADVVVGDEIRPALLLHPPASVDFPAVQLPANAVLTFRIGIDQEVWDKGGDGVDFSVFVIRSNDAAVKVFSRYVDPKHRPEDRRWIDEQISLTAFHDEEVHIKLVTAPGPADDFAFDSAVWSAPQIILYTTTAQ
jgi:hypothetical protein